MFSQEYCNVSGAHAVKLGYVLGKEYEILEEDTDATKRDATAMAAIILGQRGGFDGAGAGAAAAEAA